MDVLRFDTVTKRFGKEAQPVTALQEVSLGLESGGFAAIRGPSGCGKTTLLLTAGGLLRPDDGQVTVLDEMVYGLPSEKRAAFRAAHIGFVFQQFHLIPYLTVIENVMAPLLKKNRVEGRTHAQALLERFHLTGHAGKTPSALSTGERQRVALARALINRPKLLLADEPTGNLDEDNAAGVLDALTDFARDGGAVLLVTHDREAAQRANTIMEMRAGAL